MKFFTAAFFFISFTIYGVEKVPSEEIGTVGKGTRWEAKVYAAFDQRQFVPFQGCLEPKDKNSYIQALADKATRDQLQQDFEAIVQPEDSPFRKLLSNVADQKTKLTSEINSAMVESFKAPPRNVYWPGIKWNDKGKYGHVGFDPCSDKSFKVVRKKTRVIREQIFSAFVEVTEQLDAKGKAANVTLKISKIKVVESAPNEKPGDVQLLQNDHAHYCYKAQDDQGNAVANFSAYTPDKTDGYQIRFAKLTNLLKTDQTIVNALSPFAQTKGARLPPVKSDAYCGRYSETLEQRDLQIQIRPCAKKDEPYKTDQEEYLYMSGI